MLNICWAIALILVVLWCCGMATAYTMGGFIHVLLLVAVIAVVYQLITRRRVL
jgi:hypothetical protein